MIRRGERGLGLVELTISIGVTAMILSTLGLALVATLRGTATGKDQQHATQQLRNAFFWLNQDTQSGVASLASVAAGDVTLQWTDYSTGTIYTSRYQQIGGELVRTLTANGTPAARTVARDLIAGGFTASRLGDTITYTLTVTNGASTQSRTETATMRVTDVLPTPFATVTPAPTATSTATPTATATPTNTPTPTATFTPTATPTDTATPTFTPTDTPTATFTPTPTPTATNTPTAIPTATPTATATPSGAWLQTGSYTGNGTAGRTISGLNFQPDIIIIRSDSQDAAVIRTSAMPAGQAKEITSGNSLDTNLVTSFGASSFVVGDDALVNDPGTLYYWTAMKAGANVAVGTYTGNGSDNRNLDVTGFQPDWLITMADGDDDMFKPALLAGDASFKMDGTASSSNRIQAIRPAGFQVGSHDAVNKSGDAYYWIAFDVTSKVVTGSYTGNNNDNRNITGLGITPSFAWVKRSSNRESVWRTDAVAGDRSLYWGENTPVTDRIQSLLSDGFQVGGNQEVNNNNSTYYYLGLMP